MKNSTRRGKGLFHPDDIKTLGLSSPSVAPPPPLSAPLFSSASVAKRTSPPPRPGLSPLLPTTSVQGPHSAAPASIRPGHSRSNSFVNGVGSGSMGRSEARRIQSATEFGKYTEDDDEDYEDVFGKPNGTMSEQPMQTLQLNTRLSNRSWLGDENSDEEDPFAEVGASFLAETAAK